MQGPVVRQCAVEAPESPSSQTETDTQVMSELTIGKIWSAIISAAPVFPEYHWISCGFQTDTNRKCVASGVSGFILDPRMGVWKPLGTVTASGLTSQEGHSSSGKVGSSPPGQRREPAAPQRSGQNKTGRAASHVCQWLLRSRMALCRHTWPRFEECCAVLLPDQVSSRDPRPQKTCNKQESLSQSFSGHYLYVWSPQFVSSFKCRKLLHQNCCRNLYCY